MIEQFKSDLEELTTAQIYRKYILDNSAKMISDNMQLSLKERIEATFDVQYHDIIIVGSSKLGFSIKPNKRYTCFNDSSDIDIAIISKALFEKIWDELYKFKNSKTYWPDSGRFFKYLSYGWIRPDMFPTSKYFEFTQKWWDFYNEQSRQRICGPYRIRAGVYYSHFFLEEYQQVS